MANFAGRALILLWGIILVLLFPFALLWDVLCALLMRDSMTIVWRGLREEVRAVIPKWRAAWRAPFEDADGR